MTTPSGALREDELQTLQQLLDDVPAPLEPLDLCALDGFLCGVLLQPQPVPLAHWWPAVLDLDGRTPAPGWDAGPLQALVLRRQAELEQAIARRDWFDPWIFELDIAASPSEALLPWVAGFAAAQERYPALLAHDDPALIEPLALLYLHFAPEDLEEADALQAVIEEIEPPTDLAEAVQDLVRAVMLIADVTRPRRAAPARARTAGSGRGSRGRRGRNTR